MKQCPYCHAELPRGARACSNCGRPLPEGFAEEEQVSASEEVPPRSASQPEQAQADAGHPEADTAGQQGWDPQQNGWNARADGWQQNPQGGWNQGPQQSWDPNQQNGWNQNPQGGWNPHPQQDWNRQGGWNPNPQQSWDPNRQPGGNPNQQGWGQQGGWYAEPQQRTNALAMLSLIFGMAATVLNSLLFIPSILAIVFGIVGFVQTKKHPENYHGGWMAIVGIVMGLICLIVYGVLFARVYNAILSNPEFIQQVQQYVDSTLGLWV